MGRKSDVPGGVWSMPTATDLPCDLPSTSPRGLGTASQHSPSHSWGCPPPMGLPACGTTEGLAEPQVSGLWTPARRSSPSLRGHGVSTPKCPEAQAGSPPGGSPGTSVSGGPGESQMLLGHLIPQATLSLLCCSPWRQPGVSGTVQLPQHTQFPQVWRPLKLILRLSTNTATFRHTHTGTVTPRSQRPSPTPCPQARPSVP